jgi:hypothetical protein
MLHVVNWTTFDQAVARFPYFRNGPDPDPPRTSRSCSAGRGLRDFPVCLWALWPTRPRQLRARIKVGARGILPDNAGETRGLNEAQGYRSQRRRR